MRVLRMKLPGGVGGGVRCVGNGSSSVCEVLLHAGQGVAELGVLGHARLEFGQDAPVEVLHIFQGVSAAGA